MLFKGPRLRSPTFPLLCQQSWGSIRPTLLLLLSETALLRTGCEWHQQQPEKLHFPAQGVSGIPQGLGAVWGHGRFGAVFSAWRARFSPPAPNGSGTAAPTAMEGASGTHRARHEHRKEQGGSHRGPAAPRQPQRFSSAARAAAQAPALPVLCSEERLSPVAFIHHFLSVSSHAGAILGRVLLPLLFVLDPGLSSRFQQL